VLMRFDPFREFDRMAQLLTQQAGATRQATMPMDAYREGDRFIIHFDLPDVDPGTIDLTVEKNVLTVRAERTWQPKESQDVVVSERPHGVFSRQLFLGESLDADNIQATYDKGVLTLVIPVAEKTKPRKVEVISTGEGSQAIETTTSSESRPA
jgi:HSP20 family protein